MPKLGEIKRGNEIGGKRSYGKYIWIACEGCGKERWVGMRKGQPESKQCRSCSTRGSKCCMWRGGRLLRPDGYIEVWLSPDDFFFPMASSHKGHVLEHRLVMAKHLNRCLLSWEIVYHKNGDKKDNRLENLQVLKGRANHLASIHMQGQINKQQKEIEILKGRITLLEAENVLLKPEYSIN